MSDSLQDRGPQDRSSINVHEKWEVDYWTRALGVTEAQLVEAVMAAGPGVKNVKRHLASETAS